MSTASTKRMGAAYNQSAPPTLFLSGRFVSPAANFFETEEIEFDIVRSEEDVAIVVTDLSTGYRMNQADGYTNKSFRPPIYKEAITVNAHTLLSRVAGDDPFADVTFQKRLTTRIMQNMSKPDMKIQRAGELQASQVLTLGVVTLIDSDGTSLYSLDYKPKATHFPAAGTAWNAAGATPLADIQALADLNREDGLADSDELIFGTGSWNLFQSDAAVLALLDNRRMVLGGIAPERRGQGGTFQGWIMIGDYRFDMWTYSGRYKHPQTGVSTKFIPDDKVVVRATGGRMDAAFGAVPRIVPPDARVAPFVPTRVSSRAGGRDLWPNAWVDQTGENLFAGVSSRPLYIPTAIDTYGCLDTGI